jgi:light-regulated signal transduction histidine kinase (bacteriophytochrome)
LQTAAATDFEQALRECASEPIHQIGEVQPHGALLTIDPFGDRRILQASSNIESLLGIPLERVLGQPLDNVLDAGNTARFDLLLAHAHSEGPTTGRMTLQRGVRMLPLLAHVYLSADAAVLELERADDPRLHGRLDDLLVQTLHSMVTAQVSEESGPYFEGVARAVRDLFEYDSVMVYQFESDGDGEVIAQSRAAEAPDFLGMRFPASDIPPQARRLYGVTP